MATRSSKQAFDAKLAVLAALRQASAAEALPALHKALKDRNNFYVSRAAALAAELSLADLIPDLLAAFDHFFDDPVKSDPQCWAKDATLKALKDLGHRDPATYLRGLRYEQIEPAYPLPIDTAATIRGSCALALIDCSLPTLDLLRHLLPLLMDPEMPVRLDAIRAITHIGDPSVGLLLRLKAQAGDKAPEVQGACFSALLALESAADAVPFVAGFLASDDTDIQLEAACALAQFPSLGALKQVRAYWQTPRPTLQIREAILLNLGASPAKEAAALLREVMETDPQLASAARRALESRRGQ